MLASTSQNRKIIHYTYNGLGLRVGKTDSTGTYSYVCDGASPGSPALSDGHATYTPGLSENRAGVSTYAASDVLGNLWFLDNGAGAQTFYQDTTAFGALLGVSGTDGTPFRFGGASGCQSDADTGLVLMGHRYYDTRIGRFLSQDPAGSEDNWYAYAGNDPIDNTDPTGLVIAGGGWSGFEPDSSQAGVPYDPSQNDTSSYLNGDAGTYNEYINGAYQGTKTVGGLWDQMNMGGGGSIAMPQRGNVGDSRGQDGLNKLIQEATDKLNRGGISKSVREATQKNIKQLNQALNKTKKADGDKRSRASAEEKEQPGERAARNAANAEKRAALEAEGAEDAELLEAADVIVEVDEGLIILGVIVK